MILIKNTQRKIKIDITELKKNTQEILNALGYPDYDISIWLTTNKTVHHYNKTYRDKDKSTDILSFPYHTELKAGQRIKPKSDDDKNLGDIIISLEYVIKDLPRWEQSFEVRMKVLLVHGICHLLGYDHIEDNDYKVMHKKETELLRIIDVND
jgi:probable rRNA maturation factor